MNPDIAIIDYGVGNLHSVRNACLQFTDSVTITEDPEVIASARALILPGVGSFEAGMQGLEIRNLKDSIVAFAATGKPILGICLGAQLLLQKGYEFGEWDGLGLIEGTVRRFPDTQTSRLPHIGWNALAGLSKGDPLFADVPESSQVYYVHSYILVPDDAGHTIAHSTYGTVTFPAVIRKGNIYGCQFHPEKSAKTGMQIIRNFVTLALS